MVPGMMLAKASPSACVVVDLDVLVLGVRAGCWDWKEADGVNDTLVGSCRGSLTEMFWTVKRGPELDQLDVTATYLRNLNTA